MRLGRYGSDGITVAEAREKLHTVKKQVSLGVPPAAAKRDGRDGEKIVKGAQRFSDYTVAFIKNVRLADGTRVMKQAVIDRDILPVFGNRLMHEINPAGLRVICDKLVENRAWAPKLPLYR